jgi:hypothetical protein
VDRGANPFALPRLTKLNAFEDAINRVSLCAVLWNAACDANFRVLDTVWRWEMSTSRSWPLERSPRDVDCVRLVAHDTLQV